MNKSLSSHVRKDKTDHRHKKKEMLTLSVIREIQVLTAMKENFISSEMQKLNFNLIKLNLIFLPILVKMKDNGNPHTLVGGTVIESNPFVK